MPNAARLLDTVAGTTAGEHSGHVSPHPPLPFSGEISGGCSSNVRTNGRSAAIVTSVTTERDSCCGSSSGAVAAGSRSVRINGCPPHALVMPLRPTAGVERSPAEARMCG